MTIPYKGKDYRFSIGWPTVKTMSSLYHHFYNDIGDVTEEMERTQFGIEFVLSFVKGVSVLYGGETCADIDLT